MQFRNLIVFLFISSLQLVAATVIVNGRSGNLTCPGTSTCDISVSGYPMIDGLPGPLATAGISTSFGNPFGYPDYGGYLYQFPTPIIQSHVTAWTGNFFGPSTYINVQGWADLPSSWGDIEIFGYVLYTMDLADDEILHFHTNGGDYVDVNGQHFLFDGTHPNNEFLVQHTPGDPLRISYFMPYNFGPGSVPAEQDWFDLGIGAFPVSTPEPSTALLGMLGVAGMLFRAKLLGSKA